jgi:hypothetical protein
MLIKGWATSRMNKKRLTTALKISIAVSLTLSFVSCSRHDATPTWIADADRVAVQCGVLIAGVDPGDPLILTISGQEANEFKQAVASAEPISGPGGLKLIYVAKVYRGTNCLGEIRSYDDVFSVGNHFSRAKKGILKSLIDTPMDALASARRNRPNPQGRANERQPSNSYTNPTSGAAASRRSP